MNPETNKEDAVDLLQKNRGADLVFHLVDKAVGNVRNKEPELVEPV